MYKNIIKPELFKDSNFFAQIIIFVVIKLISNMEVLNEISYNL